MANKPLEKIEDIFNSGNTMHQH